MQNNSETILTANTHPGGGTTETVTGEKFKGDGYYGRSDGIHTVQYSISGFTGIVAIQGTLAIDPVDADWFTVYTEAHSATTKVTAINFTGNYVWVRASITDWDAGTVNSMLLNH
ncbi:hypothetical protein N9C48_00750 [bacterium]|jgi:hypothetical protein|nr:hypothetical protein [bacterium]